MIEVHPSREFISDRFPVASFVVRAPPERVFEVACATDPALFSPQYQGRRTPRNFYSSRAEGLMRAPGGMATWLVPGEQLCRFAGARRLYYAVAHYGSPRGEDPRLSISAGQPDIPFIRLSPDFTGKALDRARFGGRAQASSEARYGGGRSPALVWGGDLLGGRGRYGEAQSPAAPTDTSPAPYDDGFDPGLWTQAPADRPRAPMPDVTVPPPEPPGFEDAVALRAARPDLPAPQPTPSPAPGAFGRRYGGTPTLEEPPGLEHPPLRIGSAGRRYGSAAPAVDSPPASQPAPPVQLPRPGASTGPGVPLTVREKLRVVEQVARVTSGGERYAWIDTTAGLSWGLVGFRQQTGGLGLALAACQRRDPQAFQDSFGIESGLLLERMTSADPVARMAPIGEGELSAAPWIDRFRAAGSLDAFKYAQNQAAVEGLLDPMIDLVAEQGLLTDRGLAVALLASASLGVEGAQTALRAGPAGDLSALRAALQGSPAAGRLDALLASPDLHDTLYARV